VILKEHDQEAERAQARAVVADDVIGSGVDVIGGRCGPVVARRSGVGELKIGP